MAEAEVKEYANLVWGKKLACYIAFSRWKGNSVYTISEAFDITRQQVYIHLQKIPFPNPEARRFPRPNISDEDAKAVIRHLVLQKDGETTIPAVAEKTGLSVADVIKLCNNIRGAHAWYRSNSYPAITEWMNREGVSVVYLERLSGCSHLATFLFSPFPFHELTYKQLHNISQTIDVPIEELTKIPTAAKNIVSGDASFDDYYTIFNAMRSEHEFQSQNCTYTKLSPICVMTGARKASISIGGGQYGE